MKKIIILISSLLTVAACSDDNNYDLYSSVLPEVESEYSKMMDMIHDFDNCQDYSMYFSVSLKTNSDDDFDEALSNFDERNPDLMTYSQKKKYSSKHPNINFSIVSCDFDAFYQKNSHYIQTLSYSDTLKANYPYPCKTEEIPFRTLYNSDDHRSILNKLDILSEHLGKDPKHLFITDKDSLFFYVDNGFIKSNDLNQIDFSNEKVLIVSSGLLPCYEVGYKAERMCLGEPLEINRVACIEAKNTCDNNESWNLLILVIPNNDQEVLIDTRYYMCCL